MKTFKFIVDKLKQALASFKNNLYFNVLIVMINESVYLLVVSGFLFFEISSSGIE